MKLISGAVQGIPYLVAAFNGEAVDGPPNTYKIGVASSNDGSTWQTYAGNPILSAGSGWESQWVGQPWLLWDGSQYVIYYTGYNGTNFQIGRATCSTLTGTWTRYASNPVITFGTTGAPDEVGAGMPIVHYDVNDSPKWRMWYHAFPAGSGASNPAGLTVCYADSSDGLTWTKHGTVIPVGTSGAFNDIGTDNGPVIKVGSTWYVFAAGYHNPGSGTVCKSAYCTTTNPASAASYSSLTQLTNYTGNFTIQGYTWQSNQPRSIIPNGDGTYKCWLTLWNPTVVTTTTPQEAGIQVGSPDVTSWLPPGTPLMFPYESWDAISAENPSVITKP